MLSVSKASERPGPAENTASTASERPAPSGNAVSDASERPAPSGNAVSNASERPAPSGNAVSDASERPGPAGNTASTASERRNYIFIRFYAMIQRTAKSHRYLACLIMQIASFNCSGERSFPLTLPVLIPKSLPSRRPIILRMLKLARKTLGVWISSVNE